MRTLWVFGLGLVVLGLGCGTTADDVCSAKCDCEVCSDREYDDCLNHFDDNARTADRLGCADLYDELIACEDDTGICRGREFDTACGPERDRYEHCIGPTDSPSCVVNADCSSGGHPFCAANGRCVECLVSTDCETGKSCIASECKG